METVNGEWIMKCCEPGDPERLRTPEALAALVHEVGFLALFACEIPGFSVEERTPADAWWTGDERADPWEWRKLLAEDEGIAYGKFFDKKAGFVSKEWFPVLANFRRDGYDFDARYDDGLVSRRAKKLMDALAPGEDMRGLALLTPELRDRAGFGAGGEKNFSGVLTELQMRTYLLMGDFRQRTNKKGEGYGWHIAVMETPETKWGYDHIAAGYAEDPERSRERLFRQVKARFPAASDKDVQKVLGMKRP